MHGPRSATQRAGIMKRELETYLEAANSWDADRAALIARSEKRAWWIAGAAGLISVIALIAVAGLTPLKTVEPFIVRVDSTTGVVDVLQGYDGSAGMDEQVTRFLLKTYIETCETYTPATLERNYYTCGHYNSPQRNVAWLEQWNLQNPASPANMLKNGSGVVARVKSISFFKGGDGKTKNASIRFTKTATTGAGGAETVTDWIATTAFSYSAPSKEPAERADNPLGFRMVEYRVENEVLGAGK